MTNTRGKYTYVIFYENIKNMECMILCSQWDQKHIYNRFQWGHFGQEGAERYDLFYTVKIPQ